MTKPDIYTQREKQGRLSQCLIETVLLGAHFGLDCLVEGLYGTLETKTTLDSHCLRHLLSKCAKLRFTAECICTYVYKSSCVTSQVLTR